MFQCPRLVDSRTRVWRIHDFFFTAVSFQSIRQLVGFTPVYYHRFTFPFDGHRFPGRGRTFPRRGRTFPGRCRIFSLLSYLFHDPHRDHYWCWCSVCPLPALVEVYPGQVSTDHPQYVAVHFVHDLDPVLVACDLDLAVHGPDHVVRNLDFVVLDPDFAVHDLDLAEDCYHVPLLYRNKVKTRVSILPRYFLKANHTRWVRNMGSFPPSKGTVREDHSHYHREPSWKTIPTIMEDHSHHHDRPFPPSWKTIPPWKTIMEDHSQHHGRPFPPSWKTIPTIMEDHSPHHGRPFPHHGRPFPHHGRPFPPSWKTIPNIMEKIEWNWEIIQITAD